MKKFLLAATICLGGLAAAAVQAQPIVITNASPDWIQIGPATNPTWVLPAVIPGCGAENETTCEPTGVFYGNVAWSGAPSYISFTETDGSLSDIITFDSNGPGGVFRIQFFSDPNPGASVVPDGYVLYANYQEDDVDGAVSGPLAICCELAGVFVNLASDGESFFDPFGYGADTSDGIQFTGNVVAAVPEPGTLLLIGTGLLGLVAIRRRRSA